MKKRSIAALIAAMIVAAAGIFGSFFLAMFTNESETNLITLPGQKPAQIDPTPDISQSNREKVEAVTVSRDNVQQLIALLQRPETYQCRLEITFYYQEQSAVWSSQIWKDGFLTRVSQQAPGGAMGTQALLTQNRVYVWGEEGVYRQFPRQERDLDLYSRAPTYEDLLALPSEQITLGEIREVDGHLCVYVESLDSLTEETERWYILIENGLLYFAEGQRGGKLTYQSAMTEFQLELPSDVEFRLPDGSLPE